MHQIVLLDSSRTHLNNKALVLHFIRGYKKTCLISLVKYSTGSYSYILSPYGLEMGDYVKTIFRPFEFSTTYALGYVVLLKYLAPHTVVFNVEVDLLKGGKYAIAGGVFSLILVVDEFANQVLVQLPTGKKI